MSLATLIPASLLAAVPNPRAPTRGRYAGPREDRAHQRRAARAQNPITLIQADPAGPRAQRRMLASPRVRPPRLTPAERAHAARYRARTAIVAGAARNAAAAAARGPFVTMEVVYNDRLVFRSTRGQA